MYGVAELREGDFCTSSRIENSYIEGEIIVWFHEHITDSQIRTMNASYEVLVRERSIVTPNRMIIEVPAGKEHEYIDIYNALSEVRVAALNRIVEATWTPNDTYYNLQWHFNKPGFIYLEDAWDIEQGGNSSVIIAILDTGVAYENYSVPAGEQSEVTGSTYTQAPDLAGTSFISPYDFIHYDLHPNDQNGHGTHVCGTIAQTTNNALGIAGMAFNCTIMPIQVLNYNGSGYSSTIADGIDWARVNGADVINMSLRATSPIPAVEAAIEDAYAAGIVTVAATGNDSNSSIGYPARYLEVIAVGSVQWDGTRAPYSNYGSGMELTAPGGNTLLDQNGDGYADGVLQQTYAQCNDGTYLADVTSFSYWFFQGTSMACPHVSGLVGLMISNGCSGVSSIRTILHNSATDLGAAGYDTEYGYGLINCYQSVLAVAIGDRNFEESQSSWGFDPLENPSHGGAFSVRISVAVPGPVELHVYDITGRKVMDISREYTGGEHTVNFQGLMEGIYFCHMRAGNFSATERMVVIR